MLLSWIIARTCFLDRRMWPQSRIVCHVWLNDRRQVCPSCGPETPSLQGHVGLLQGESAKGPRYTGLRLVGILTNIAPVLATVPNTNLNAAGRAEHLPVYVDPVKPYGIGRTYAPYRPLQAVGNSHAVGPHPTRHGWTTTEPDVAENRNSKRCALRKGASQAVCLPLGWSEPEPARPLPPFRAFLDCRCRKNSPGTCAPAANLELP